LSKPINSLKFGIKLVERFSKVGLIWTEIDFNGIEIDGFLKKPFQVDLLVHIVRKLAMPTVTLANTYCL